MFFWIFFVAFLLLFPLLGNWVNTNTGSVHGGEEPVQVGSKAELQVTWEKMSKSKHNSLDPQQQYGIDTVRLYILYTAPPEQDILWDVKRLSQVRNPLSPLLSRSGDVLQQPWPTSDPLYLETPDTLELVVWTNNKVYGTVLVPQQVAQDTEQVQALVLGSKLGQHLLGYRTIKKAILFHRTALINFLKEEQPLNPGC
uniref:leucine--tRNA ligase n=2 Tax=Oncorhynchus tshawytscha TaxID=74940 RepID=A0AAZ3QV83_ONCTS